MTTRSRSSGFTLLELVVVAALLGVLIQAVSTMMMTGGDAQEYAKRLNRATELSQEIVDRVRTEMVSCVRLFGNDTEGLANLALLDLAGAPVPLAGLRLPTPAPTEKVRVDTPGAEITGNTLFYARLAWSDHFVCSSGNAYMVDVYRWSYFYLTAEDGGPQPGSPLGLNLVHVRSEPLADGAAIDRIADPTDRAEFLQHLHDGTPDALGEAHDPCVVVWRRGDLPSVAGTLRMIDGSSGTLSNTPIGSRPSPWSVLRDEWELAGLLSYRHHSIATNYSFPSLGVGKFSVVSLSGDGFPHGFEVQTVGPSNGRKTLLHVVVVSTNRRGQPAWSDVQMVIDTHDL